MYISVPVQLMSAELCTGQLSVQICWIFAYVSHVVLQSSVMQHLTAASAVMQSCFHTSRVKVPSVACKQHDMHACYLICYRPTLLLLCKSY